MKHHRAFTLVELIVVIGIIGVLSGIIIASFSGGTETARAAKCLSNMRNLAQGAIGYMVHNSCYPAAGSHAVFSNEVNGNGDILYKERKGWISWLSMNDEYKNKRTSVVTLPNISACCADETKAAFAITNGALWKSVGQSKETYVCPEHAILASAKGVTLRFSYAMNAYFRYDVEPGEAFYDEDDHISMNDSSDNLHADRTLLFAELPFGTAGSSYDTANTRTADGKAYDTSDGNAALDCILQYKASYNGMGYNTDWKGSPEAIAFNHRNGRKKWCAHVVFADGHVEKLSLPKGGSLNAETLTALLCGGVAVTFDGSGYSMPNDADKGRNN